MNIPVKKSGAPTNPGFDPGILNAIAAPVYATDAEGFITFYNHAAAELWGREPVLGAEQWCGTLRIYSVDGRLMPHHECPMAIALREDRPVYGLHAIGERPDGSRFLFRPHPTPVHDADGTLIGAVNLLLDVTAHIDDQAKLNAAKEDLAGHIEALALVHGLALKLSSAIDLKPAMQAILDTIVELHGAQFGLICLFDSETNELFATAHFGFSDELIESAGRYIPQPNIGVCATAFLSNERAIVTDTSSDPIFAHVRDFVCGMGIGSAHSTPFNSRAGERLGVLSLHFKDRRLPTELQLQLTDMCARQAAEVVESVRSRQALRDADEKKDEFLALLAHELRNPLAPIRNGVSLLRARPDLPPRGDLLDMIERQVDHMVRLVNDLMDVSRITRGKLALSCQDLHVAEILDTAIEIIRPAIDSSGHSLTISGIFDDVTVHGDKVRLSQAVANVLGNAAKYSEGGTAIDVTLRCTTGIVEIAVQDKGIGLAPDQTDKIFEMFSQTEAALSRSRGGLGIGLGLAKRIISMHGGDIAATSDGIGRGSTFTISLPQAENSSQVEVSSSADTLARGGHRVLIVDDNEPSAQTLAWILEADGHDARFELSSLKAIESAKAFRPQIILLDIGMPEMNGYELCAALKALPELQKSIFVAQTGWGTSEHRELSRKAGFNHHLVKPIDLAELQRIAADI